MSRLLPLLVLFCAQLSGAQVSFTAEPSRDQIALNENVKVTFSMNVQGDNFTPPVFSNFRIVSGPNQAVSQIWINGKSKIDKSYTYILKPLEKGELKIQQAVITHDGKEYKTIPFNITVTDAVEEGEESPGYDIGKNIRLVAEVSNPNPYLNEGIQVVYKLYISTSTGITGWDQLSTPQFKDFWSQEIGKPDYNWHRGTYDGEPYRYTVLRSVLLYPQKSGKLELEPFTMDLDVKVPTNQRDYFGRTRYTVDTKRFTAGKRTITVKPLPGIGKPQNFSGAVGDFTFSRNVSKTELQSGESLTVEVRVSGSGNLKLFGLPDYSDLPSGLEVYEPEHSQNVSMSGSGMRGSITDKYTIVPQAGGNYELPPLSFNYFNPATGKYETKQVPAKTLTVEGAPIAAQSSPGSNNRGGVAVTDQRPFAFIMSDTRLKESGGGRFFNSTGYWVTTLGVIALIPIALLVRRKREQRAADVVGNRKRKANKLSRKYLSEAQKSMDDSQGFYEALERALHNYLRSKLAIQTAEMSKEKIGNLLTEKGATQETKDDFINLLDRCEIARYTPTGQTGMREDYKQASEVLGALDKQIKK